MAATHSETPHRMHEDNERKGNKGGQERVHAVDQGPRRIHVKENADKYRKG